MLDGTITGGRTRGLTIRNWTDGIKEWTKVKDLRAEEQCTKEQKSTAGMSTSSTLEVLLACPPPLH